MARPVAFDLHLGSEGDDDVRNLVGFSRKNVAVVPGVRLDLRVGEPCAETQAQRLIFRMRSLRHRYAPVAGEQIGRLRLCCACPKDRGCNRTQAGDERGVLADHNVFSLRSNRQPPIGAR